MEDDQKRRDYGDFFKDSEQTKQSAENRHDNNGEDAYFYTYGRGGASSASDADSSGRESAMRPSFDEQPAEAEITAPRPIRPISGGGGSGGGQEGGNGRSWEFSNPRRRSPLKSLFASFMVGVLVMGSLMYVSDKMNLFTGGDQGILTQNVQSASGIPQTDSGTGIGSAASSAAALDAGRPNNISGIAKNASPAVVQIETYVNSIPRSDNSLFNDPFFRQFFGDRVPGQDYNNSQSQNNGKPQPLGMGSGFIFDKSGYILTNEHVIDGADEIMVTVEGYEKPFKAKLLGSSYDLDLAALKIEGTKDFPVLKLGDANALSVGDWVVAIGNPYGFDHTVTVGVLSAKERPIDIPDNKGTRHYQHLLQTDASINPGNSGGPLLNLQGEVIGINTAVSAQAQGIGFAIPTSTISSVLNNLKNNIKVPHPYIGIVMRDIQKDWVRELKLDGTDGAVVTSVVQGSPADKAGLQPYDVILDVDGVKVNNADDLSKKIQAHKVGEHVNLGIVRNGTKMITGVTIGDRPN
ncbi:S1C family serine protease [Ferviditalea candida]|uniref:Trypsin-like peptidase domain-containing protein n=1 Tax=Ferviditalea candida TaxID=3108399 RepID=A0ABU5ZIZ1_9BACL|nr:trypsin-like peptidase domain-containing protein [Paenibacillaceae bacterium T2]